MTHKAIMIASSGQNPLAFAKQADKLSTDNLNVEKTPLSGINIDILHVQDISKRWEPYIKILQTSKYKNKLLTKSYIISQIKQSLSYCSYTRFFFSGHGYYEGAMCIQTVQHPDGQPFYIQQLYDLFIEVWKQQQKWSEDKYFNIVLDCCYAGRMAIRLKDNRKIQNKCLTVSVYCSSGPNHPSLDMKYYGGLLICRLWSNWTKFLLEEELKELKQKFEQKKPVRLSSSWFDGAWKIQFVDWDGVWLT